VLAHPHLPESGWLAAQPMTSPNENAKSSGASAIRSRVASGGAAVGASTVVRSLLEFSATLVTARLLTPNDFGLVGMVLAIVGFVDMFKDLGLATITVQREHLSQDELNGLFWLTVALGTGLSLFTAASAPLISWGYGQPSLTKIGLVLSSCLFLSGLSVQHQALLRRELKFERLAIVQTAGTLASVVTAIGGALCGLGVWALVLKQVAGPFVNVIGTWIAMRWQPGRPRRTGLSELLRMGRHVTGFQVSNYVERNLDNVLIGRFSGALELGCYSRAYDLLRLPLQQIADPAGTVALPTLSRLIATPDRYRDAYLRMARSVLLFTIPFSPFLVICGDWLVELAFGPQWLRAIPMFRWLGIGLLVKPLNFTLGWLLVSQGRTRELFRWGLIATGLAALSFVFGLRWGAVGVAASYSAVDLLARTPILIRLVGRGGPVSVRDLLQLLVQPWFCAAAVTGALLTLRHALGANLRPAVGTTLAALITLGVTAAATWSTASGRSSVHDLLALLRRRKPA
jgi:O-antigen/teichoic acid export membrane protein